MTNQYCYGCNKHRGIEGGKYVVTNTKQVKFRCKECISKVKKVKPLK